MSYTLLDFIYLLGSLGIFIYGMKVMSEGIQKASGSGLRKALSSMTSNRFLGVFTGFLVTALVQSSSATTVMVVSFVNAGLLSLTESISVIMGANIGTTVTAWIVSELGFKVKIVSVAIPMIGLSFPFMFSKNEKWKNIAEFVMGFGILFIGLGFLKDSVPDIRSNPDILSFVQHYGDLGPLSVGLFVLIGALLTVVVQSSSASTALVLVMVNQQWIDFDLAAAMFLGGNLGTTVTAALAASAANLAGKRAAMFHFLFNVLGVLWALAFFSMMASWISTITSAVETNLALFHTIFNTVTVVVLLPFVGQLEKLVLKILPSSSDEDTDPHLQYITSGILETNEISVEQASKQVQVLGDLSEKMFRDIYKMIIEKSKKSNDLKESIARREEIADNIQHELSEYLSKVSQHEVTSDTSANLYALFRMGTELERITDIVFQMSLSAEKFHKNNSKMGMDLKEELRELFDRIRSFISLMNESMKNEMFELDLKSAYKLEAQVNELRTKLHKNHYQRLESGVYQGKGGVIFYDLVNSCEKIGDHLTNIFQASDVKS